MEAITQSLPSHYQPELLKQLDLLRRNDNFCDVTIVFNSREFKAHKCVLAVSPFFAKYLTRRKGDRERNFIKVNLDGVTPSIMEDLLTYIYTGDILVTEENTKNLTALRDDLFPQNFNTNTFLICIMADVFLRALFFVFNHIYTPLLDSAMARNR